MRSLREILGSLLEKHELSFDELQSGIEAGDFMLWREGDSVMVTEIISSPRVKAMNVFLAAGAWSDIFVLKERAEMWAKINGCGMIGLSGRKGWKRRLAPFGYVEDEPTYVRNI